MFELPKLPYETTSLAPYISARTVKYHYLKHHKGYIDKLNELIDGTGFANMSLEEIIKISYNKTEFTDIYHNAAQVWNHNFYWQCLSPNAQKPENNRLLKQITNTFGSFENFRSLIIKKAVSQFGSGWVWLALDNLDNLLVYSTDDADNPFIHNNRALLTIDVWEHAYYLDYQNKRADYVAQVFDHLIDWQNISTKL